MGVPLPRGLRCQGSAWYGEVGHCPESHGWRIQDRGGREVSGRGCLTTEVRLCGDRRREGERSDGGEFALSPTRKTQRPPGDGEICGEWKSLLLFISFYVFIVHVIGSSFSGGFSALLHLFIVAKINL